MTGNRVLNTTVGAIVISGSSLEDPVQRTFGRTSATTGWSATGHDLQVDAGFPYRSVARACDARTFSGTIEIADPDGALQDAWIDHPAEDPFLGPCPNDQTHEALGDTLRYNGFGLSKRQELLI